jgi:hypothetical protein
MRELCLGRAIATAILVLGLSAAASASPITYTETSFAAGTIGGIAFSEDNVVLTMHGSTDQVQTFVPVPGALEYANASFLTTLTIPTGPATGTYTIAVPTGIWVFPQAVPIAPGMPVLPYVIFGTVDHPPVLDSFTGLGGNGSPALTGYNLQTGFGPLTSSPGGVGRHTGHPVLTDGGLLDFSFDISPTSTGTFQAVVQPVPEPGTLVLFGAGIVALAGRLRLRARR